MTAGIVVIFCRYCTLNLSFQIYVKVKFLERILLIDFDAQLIQTLQRTAIQQISIMINLRKYRIITF